MIAWLRSKWEAVTVGLAALAAILWALLEHRHRSRRDQLRGQAEAIDGRRTGSLHEAHRAGQKADAHAKKAATAARRGKAAIDKIRTTNHENLADRIDAYRDRVRERSQ